MAAKRHKKAVANSNIENPHYQPKAKGPVRARRFSVVSSPWENGFVTKEKRGWRRSPGTAAAARAVFCSVKSPWSALQQAGRAIESSSTFFGNTVCSFDRRMTSGTSAMHSLIEKPHTR
jgi:hypothetical protein